MSDSETREIQRWLGRYRCPARRHYRSGLAAEAASVMLLVAQAFLAARIIDAVFLSGSSLEAMCGALWMLAAITLMRGLCAGWVRHAGLMAAQRIKRTLRDRLLSRWLDRPAPTDLVHGEMAALVGEGIERTEPYFGRYLPQKSALVIRPLVVAAAVLARDPWSGALLLVTGPLIPLFMVLIGDAAQKKADRQWASLQQMGGHLLDLIRGLPTLVELAAARRAGRIREVSEAYRTATMSVLRTAFLSGLVLELAASLSTAVVAVSIGVRLIEGVMTYEPALFVLILTPEFYLPFRQFGAERHAAMDAEASGRMLRHEIDASRALVPHPVQRPRAGGGAAVPSRSPLILDGVTFAYPGRERPAVSDLHLEFEPGRIHVLAGPSGAGKSTLMRLLLGHLAPDAGAIRIGDVDLATVSPEAWHGVLTWIPQRPSIFHGTLAGNLRLADPAADPGRLREAAAFANLMPWVKTLPLGLDTRIGEGGVTVSGGQRQRIALARAFLRRTPWLFLDEPESGLDPGSEAVMTSAMRELARGRTVIVIAHRRHTIRQADRLVWMASGRVVEAGLPDEVLARLGGAAC